MGIGQVLFGAETGTVGAIGILSQKRGSNRFLVEESNIKADELCHRLRFGSGTYDRIKCDLVTLKRRATAKLG